MASQYGYLPILYLNQLSSSSSSSFDEQQWLSQVRSALGDEEPLGEDDEPKAKVSVFFVPKSLLFARPEAYVPQLVAVGPYHHRQPHLSDMERCKLAAARRIQEDLPGFRHQELVHCLLRQEQRIRAFYHKNIEFSGEALAWMMAIDASFLLEFLRSFSPSRKKTTYNMITRDLLMVENQIPLYLLRKILRRRRQCSPALSAGDELSAMLIAFVKEVSPFKSASCFSVIDSKQHPHLLHVLYSTIVNFTAGEEEEFEIIDCPIETMELSEESGSGDQGFIRRLLGTIKKLAIASLVKLLVKLPWKIISSFPVISVLKEPIQTFLTNGGMRKMIKKEDPLAAEITIPSATELAGAGILFSPAAGDLASIRFEAAKKPITLYLPPMILDVNTEAIMRNLVAFETTAPELQGTMTFTRYTELMNGIIDAEDDVKILRESGIIVNRMKSDREAAALWNGMSRAVKVSKVEFMDRVVEEVNGYFERSWKVKAKRVLRRYVFGSWQALVLLAAIVFLLQSFLLAFCNLYGCGARWLRGGR